ncbi:unnamed protein product [marine sediment metagenome]|uniref:Uncharacterized protein n=1 Tax=marine sediment metagenome TaxID=412755 RepID=X1K6X5_9ZZZZ
MIIADHILNGIGFLIKGAINFLPENVPFFTLSDLTNLLNSVENFWINSFSLGSHFFPFALFFSIILLILLMELSLLTFKAIKFAVNILRGSGA